MLGEHFRSPFHSPFCSPLTRLLLGLSSEGRAGAQASRESSGWWVGPCVLLPPGLQRWGAPHRCGLGGGLGPALQQGGQTGAQCPRDRHADGRPAVVAGASPGCGWLHSHSPTQNIKFVISFKHPYFRVEKKFSQKLKHFTNTIPFLNFCMIFHTSCIMFFLF